MDIAQVKALIDLAKAEGLSSLTVGAVSFTFKAEPTVAPRLEDLAALGKDLSESSGTPTDEELLFWSSES